MDDRSAPCKALVLAGGGARGSYQVGVWRALMELDWHPQIITGTSVGSLNGAMFVLDQYETARDMWLAIRSKDVMELPEEDADLSALHQFLRSVVKAGGMGCPTIKPWNKEAVFEKLDILNSKGIFAAAMDIDGAGLPFLKAMNPNAGSKTVEEMREIIGYAKMPFIIKGIMTPAGALKAVEAGAKAIVVSNHGGRVQGGVPSTAEVLPAIAEAVKGKITILVDGGIRSGVDVFRAIALGADGVLIGRPMLTMIYGGGEEGFKVYMNKLVGELKSTMTMCGAASLKDISRDMIWLGK